ncbi:hypothetical protein [Candidatus Mycobacterium methanotrophicum]|uniref:Exported repetitive protein Erp n=1 Tax=Candidatus Mycobacterium methanotrophicum TaxID=2943498 RepID=A0ABY4QJB2_9MYCO|nr:hypothetical protein [Candidatus Mycobacterium methanotrophicum]UQX11105.1 hypothetical protein M5I08_00475 [Candidatus Mycobacterium methanotrophicum]
MPNRRRRRLSTATSAVAALAVACPFAYVAVCNVSADTKPAAQHREFVRAAGMTDLPGELMSALSQGLSQFGVNLPPVPSLTGATSPGLTSPGLTSPGLTSPGLTTPGLTTPGLTSPGLTSPGLTSPGLTTPGLTSPGLTTPGLTPGVTPGTAPGLTPGAAGGLTSPSLTNPGLTSPTGPTGPTGFDPSSGGLTNPSELPISDPIGLDPGAGGTYPILGDPSLGAAPASGASGGLVSDLMSAANQLGAGQAIDLLKGVLMPGIMQAAQGANPAAALPVPAPPVP